MKTLKAWSDDELNRRKANKKLKDVLKKEANHVWDSMWRMIQALEEWDEEDKKA